MVNTCNGPWVGRINRDIHDRTAEIIETALLEGLVEKLLDITKLHASGSDVASVITGRLEYGLAQESLSTV